MRQQNEDATDAGGHHVLAHGDADSSAPVDVTARRAAVLLPGCSYREYPAAGHDPYVSHAAQLNADVLEFKKS